MLHTLRLALAPLLFALASLFMLTPNLAAAHNDDAYYAGTDDLVDQSKWMSRVPDATRLVHMSIPGTHDSGSLYGADPFVTPLLTKTQSLTIAQQLKAGIRFLDIRLRHVDNRLAVHHGSIHQQQMFEDVLRDVTRFLEANPTETVLVRVKEEHAQHNATRRFHETFRDFYFNPNRNWFATPPAHADNDPTLGAVRGKIVLLHDFAGEDLEQLGWHYRGTFYRQHDNWALHKPSDLHEKWINIKGALGTAERHGAHHITYLSGAMGGVIPIFPYFVASGHSSMGTGAPRMTTGLTTPGWADNFPEFPRVDCFIGICTIAYEGTNTLTKDWIHRVQPTYVGLVVADFPGAGLIRSVIDTNFRSTPLLNETNGLCLDIAYGVGAGHALLTHPCHGGDNQKFRFSGEQILVGGLCLDVANGNNANGAAVVAWPCHGGQNQKWRRNTDGTIQSLLAGPARCLDLDTSGAIRLQGCWPSSSDQRFWHKSVFPTLLLVNESNNQCADIRGGIGKSHALITWACKGSDNQKFKFDGEQLLVGGMCLDVRGNRNVHHAEVVSHPCNGQQNQKWRLNADGTIQSLMPGEARCLDLATENANEIRLRSCTSHPDQKFLRVPL